MEARYAVARQTGIGGGDYTIIREFDTWQEAEDWYSYAINTDAYGYGTLEIIRI